MFFYEGYICPVCKKKFQESDDIVACPDCGAPHHRDCWKQEGQCHFAADHDTPRQWKRPAESTHADPGPAAAPDQQVNGTVKFCTRCGQQNPEFAEFCSRCGQKLDSSDWSSQNSQQNPPSDNTSRTGNSPYGNAPFSGNNAPFGRNTMPFGSYGEYSPFHIPVIDPYGGVPHEEKIDDITADELVAYVGGSSAYYIPRFFKMDRKRSHASWNWPAFLFTPYWLLYRKNYLAGGIVLFLSLLQNFVNIYILGAVLTPHLDMSSNASMYQSLETLIEEGSYSNYFTIIFLMFLATLLVKIIIGLIGNSLYLHNSLSRIQKIRDNTHSAIPYQENMIYRQELAAAGGVSLVLVAIASGVVWFAQVLFQTLFFSI